MDYPQFAPEPALQQTSPHQVVDDKTVQYETQNELYEESLEKVQLWRGRLSKCAVALAVISSVGAFVATVPFIAGVPDFTHPPPPPPPPHFSFWGPPPEPRENPNEAREQHRQKHDRYEHRDAKWKKEWDNRFTEPSEVEDVESNDAEDDQDLTVESEGRQLKQQKFDDKKPDPEALLRLTNDFYRFNFFSLIKWSLVLVAAILARKVSKSSDLSYKESKWSFKRAALLLLFATIIGLGQMHFQHNFFRGMRRIHHPNGPSNKHHGDKKNWQDTERKEKHHKQSSISFLNEDSSDEKSHHDRHLRHDPQFEEERPPRHFEDKRSERDGPPRRRCGKMKFILTAVISWFAIVGSFLYVFKKTVKSVKNYRNLQVTSPKLSAASTGNKKVAAVKVAEEDVKKAEAVLKKAAEKAKKTAEKAKKAEAKLKKAAELAKKASEKVKKTKKAATDAALKAERPKVNSYVPPVMAPLPEFSQETEQLLMPPAETTYTIEQVQTLLNMERERLLNQ